MIKKNEYPPEWIPVNLWSRRRPCVLLRKISENSKKLDNGPRIIPGIVSSL
jgi:hypothetical protein